MSAEVDLMYALELALDVAYHDGSARDLAVAAEAWSLAGYHDGSIMVSHSEGHDDLLERVAAARHGRPKRLLRADARGMVAAFRLLINEGAIDHVTLAEANRQRWIARGGHDYFGVHSARQPFVRPGRQRKNTP